MQAQYRDSEDSGFDPLPDESIIKTGWLSKKGRRGNWKNRWFVLRPDRLAYYKDEKEYKTLRIIPTIDINTVTFIKAKRADVFAIFTSSRTYYLQAPSTVAGQGWILALLESSSASQMRKEEELGLSPPKSLPSRSDPNLGEKEQPDDDIPPTGQPLSSLTTSNSSLPSHNMPSKGNELNRITSIDSSADYFSGTEVYSPGEGGPPSFGEPQQEQEEEEAYETDDLEGLDSDRVIAQGYLLCLKSQIRQWRRRWVVLRGHSFTLYKNFEEYKPIRILPLDCLIAAHDIDPLSRTKRHCFQAIFTKKVLRFCADSEVEVDRWLGGFQSLIAARKEEKEGDRNELREESGR